MTEQTSFNCIIVHGCTENEQDVTYDKHWMPWVQQQLTAAGIPTIVPSFPEPWKPDYTSRKKVLEEHTINEHTILIGHSCGAAFLVRWLGETQKKINTLILVAPWNIPYRKDASDVEFFSYTIDQTIKERVKTIVIFTSDDEDDDGKKSAQHFYEALGGTLIELKGKGHYTLEDMGTEAFPELVENITQKLSPPKPIPANIHEAISKLQAELQPLRKQLELLNTQKETAFQKKEQLKKALQENIGKLKALQLSHKQKSEGLQEAKKHKNEERTALQKLREELKQLREQKKKEPTTKGNPHLLKRKIEQLELSIETEGYDYKKEQKVMKEIKKLTITYKEIKGVDDLHKKMRQLTDNIREHGQQFEVYATIMQAAGRK